MRTTAIPILPHMENLKHSKWNQATNNTFFFMTSHQRKVPFEQSFVENIHFSLQLQNSGPQLKKAASLHHQLLHPKQNCVPETCFAILFLEIFCKKTLFLGIISPFFPFAGKNIFLIFLFYCTDLVKEPTNDSNSRSLAHAV